MAHGKSSRLGNLLLTGFIGRKLTDSVATRLVALRPAGVVLFARNVGTPEELTMLTRDLRRVLGANAIISVDQEGGRVTRLRAPFTQWPPMREVGTIPGTKIARRIGFALGQELASVGINTDFAPVLDVDSNPNNPIIGDRAFAAEPARVARLALAFAAGLEEAGIRACGKHFPGHGDTHEDSHFGLPVVNRSRRDLDRLELAPFRRAVRAGLSFLMTAHIVYPQLDAENPATLSRTILHDLLRKEFGFDGVIASDDLAMEALSGIGGVGARAVAAVGAGCDLILACQRLGDGEKAVAALASAERRGRLDPAAIRASLGRVRALRRSLTDTRRRPVTTAEA
ncbi:MAG: beta-N-acetylhexosaminidase, partial [Deltaproteobacteria bacterium]